MHCIQASRVLKYIAYIFANTFSYTYWHVHSLAISHLHLVI